MTLKTILALDLGTTTGWALRDPAGSITHGFASFKPQRFEGGGMRFLRFKRWLTEIKATTEQGIDAVYFEEVRRHLGVDAAGANTTGPCVCTSTCSRAATSPAPTVSAPSMRWPSTS